MYGSATKMPDGEFELGESSAIWRTIKVVDTFLGVKNQMQGRLKIHVISFCRLIGVRNVLTT